MKRPSSRKRRGAALIVALVVLALVSGFVAVWLSAALRQRRQLRFQEQRLQALLLAEAGLERAQAQLAAEPKYLGETWSPRSSEDENRLLGAVVLRVQPPQVGKGLQITAVATVPAAGPPAATVELVREFTPPAR